MKITTIMLFVSMLTVSAGSLAQQEKFNLKLSNANIIEVFEELKERTDFGFVFRAEQLDLNKRYDLNKSGVSLVEVLNELLEEGSIGYRIVDNNVIIVENKVMRNENFIQETFVLTGTVSDAHGAPLPGVNVFEKADPTKGVITNFDGEYSIEVSSPDAVIQYSFIGFEAQTVNAGGRSEINITLLEEMTDLDEVVVVGYGVQKKANLTGAVAAIDAEKLENRPITSTSQGLQGMVPNLNITFGSGEPGNSGAKYNIRGGTSITGNGDPLILVDGVEQDLDLINPNDIENISVLKDAGAAAIYGARAAFGVILVTTKQAKKDQPTRVSYSGQWAFSKPTIMPDLVKSSYTFAQNVNAAMLASGNQPRFNDEQVARYQQYEKDPVNTPSWEIVNNEYRFNGYTDWQKELIRDYAPSQQHNIKFSGGSGKTSYYTSIAYLGQEGLYKNGTDEFKRINIRSNLNTEITSWLDMGFKVAYNRKNTDKPHVYKSDANYINSVIFSSPTSPLKYEGDNADLMGMYFPSPAAYQKFAGRDKLLQNDLWLTTTASFKVTSKLKVNTDFSFQELSRNNEQNATHIEFIESNLEKDYADSYNDYVRLDNWRRNHYAFNLYGEYENRFNEQHYLKAMAGYNQEWRHEKSFYAQRRALISEDIPAINLAQGEQTVDGSEQDYAIRGAFFRLNYSFRDKYLVEFNGRYDGTSRFQKSDRFSFFPSISAGWRISEESFMEPLRGFMSNFKLRGSYGSLGNQKTDNYYEYIPEMESGNSTRYLFGGKPALYIRNQRLIPASLTWETVTTIDFGFDMTLFDNKLEIIFDKYKRITSDMLMKKGTYPDILGTTAPYENAAELETDGWELSLAWNQRVNPDLQFGVQLSLSDYQTEITKYDNPTGALNDYFVGKKFGDIWGYETEGFYQSESDVSNHADQRGILDTEWKPGDIMYKDLNGDGYINQGDNTLENPGDQKLIGNSSPRYSYGIGLNSTYKNLFVNVFFQGIGKREVWPGDDSFWPYVTQYYQIQKHFITDSWSEDNREAYFARPLARDSRNRQKQSKYIQDASYIRLKNITLGCNLPKQVLSKVGLSKGQIFVSGENIWFHSKIGKPYDPEGIGDGTRAGMMYPFMKTYSMGLNLTF